MILHHSLLISDQSGHLFPDWFVDSILPVKCMKCDTKVTYGTFKPSSFWSVAYLHGEGIQGYRDRSVLSKPSSNFWREGKQTNKQRQKNLCQNDSSVIHGIYVIHIHLYCYTIASNCAFPWIPTLLVFGQFHRAVDVGRHLLAGEVTALLVSRVGVVSLCL